MRTSGGSGRDGLLRPSLKRLGCCNTPVGSNPTCPVLFDNWHMVGLAYW